MAYYKNQPMAVGHPHHTKAEITKLETRVEYLEAELEAKKLIDKKNIPETKEVLR